MSEPTPPNRSLSEISHLFLSSVRDRQTQGAPRPQRTPPAKLDVSIDLTPEEYAQVFGGSDDGAPEPAPLAPPEAPLHAPPVSAVLASHFNGKQFERVKDYARRLASRVGRIGLIELDASEFRLMCFDPSGSEETQLSDPQCAECYDVRQMAQAMAELNCDVNQWLLLVSTPRSPEAKALLRDVGHWILLSTCDHDGVVSSYRLLKGMSDAVPAHPSARPRLSLALFDAFDEGESTRVARKLASVTQQFLSWPLTAEPPVQSGLRVAEHLVLFYGATRDKGQMANAPQWALVGEFLAQANAACAAAASVAASAPAGPAIIAATAPSVSETPAGDDRPSAEPEEDRTMDSAQAQTLVDMVIPMPIPAPIPMAVPTADAPASAPASAPVFPRASSETPADKSAIAVLDLDGNAATPATVLAAILRQTESGLIECPLRAPGYDDARLAVSRERELVLIAVAGAGLRELRRIGQAYRWLTENRSLVAMALPQFAIDAGRLPVLRLVIDHADSSAELLAPMLQSELVTVQAYRSLKWGEKTGVFLEAA